MHLSGAPHVPLEGLQIGPHKDPWRKFAYEKSLTCCGRGCVVGWSCVSNRQQAWLWVLWTLPLGNTERPVDSVNLSWFPKKNACIVMGSFSPWLQKSVSVSSYTYIRNTAATCASNLWIYWLILVVMRANVGIWSEPEHLHHTPGTLGPYLQVQV